MKRIKFLFLPAVFLPAVFLLLASCAGRQSFIAAGSADFSNSAFTAGDISVITDKVNDVNLSWQLRQYAGIVLAKLNHGMARTFTVDCKIVQNSYIKGFCIQNSINGVLFVKDEEGKVLYIRDYCRDTKDSVVSAVMQQKVFDLLCTRLQKEVLRHEKRFQKLIKKEAKKNE